MSSRQMLKVCSGRLRHFDAISLKWLLCYAAIITAGGSFIFAWRCCCQEEKCVTVGAFPAAAYVNGIQLILAADAASGRSAQAGLLPRI
jgi:hypothetical protein